MHPYLFDWELLGHHLRPPTYGVLLALAFSVGYFESIRRTIKLEENPKHHGYHAGGLIRCNWVAGVGNSAIIYEVSDDDQVVTLLRFVSLDDV